MDTIITQRRRLLVGIGAIGGIGALGAVAIAARGRPQRIASSTYAAFGGATMGSSWAARVDARAHDARELRAVVQAELDAVEQRLSLFRPDSELVRFNRAAGSVDMSVTLHAVLAAATDVSRWSDGAFDATVAPLVEAWGFGTRGVRHVPRAAEVEAGRRQVDWRSLVPDPARARVVKLRPDAQADLGGIAKGYAVDRAAAALEARGVAHYMVEAGGEVRARGVNSEGRAWRIGIEEPDASVQRARWAVPLAGGAMATSGDYRNYYMHDGVRYSHEIDARAGAPIRHTLCSVSVVADDCMRADALATALIVLGPQRGPALAEASGIAALFIERRGAALVDRRTTALVALGAERA